MHYFFFCNLHCTKGLLLSQPVLKREASEREEPSAKGRGASEKQEKEVQSSSEWVCVSEREKVRVG